MKTRKLLFTVVLLALLTSCSSTKTGVLSTPAYAPSAEINAIRANVDVDMSKKLEGESSSTYFLFFRTGGDNKFVEGMRYETGLSVGRIGKTKSAAAYNAIEGTDADIIVHPNYVVEVENFLFFKKIKVKVTGYTGRFTKFYQKEYCDECNDDEIELNIDVKSKNK